MMPVVTRETMARSRFFLRSKGYEASAAEGKPGLRAVRGMGQIWRRMDCSRVKTEDPDEWLELAFEFSRPLGAELRECFYTGAGACRRKRPIGVTMTNRGFVAPTIRGDADHRLDASQRRGTHRCFARKHQRVRLFESGVGNVGHLRAGRSGTADHRFEQLRGDDHPASEFMRATDDASLQNPQLLEFHLHTEVAAGDHDHIGGLNDRIDVADRLLVLDLISSRGRDRRNPGTRRAVRHICGPVGPCVLDSVESH